MHGKEHLTPPFRSLDPIHTEGRERAAQPSNQVHSVPWILYTPEEGNGHPRTARAHSVSKILYMHRKENGALRAPSR